MALSNHAYDFEDLHPIDIVEDIATHQEWQFDRIADDQISMEMAGQWRSYSITLAWCEADQTLFVPPSLPATSNTDGARLQTVK